MQKIGFIDYYLDEWHANNYPEWIREASGGEMEVVFAYAGIDSPIGGRTTEQWCQDMKISRCDTIEELVNNSDAIIVLSPDNSEKHEELCQIPLKSGKLTYIDKTFTPDGPAAKRLFGLAGQYGTPCYSTSALRYATEYSNVDTDGIIAINCWGPGKLENYSIHQLEPLMMLMKTPGKRVMYLPDNQWYLLVIEFTDGRKGTISGYEEGSPFSMNICAKSENQVITVESDFFHDFIVDLVDYFRCGVVKVPHDETINIMAIRGAATAAMDKPGQWIEI